MGYSFRSPYLSLSVENRFATGLDEFLAWSALSTGASIAS